MSGPPIPFQPNPQETLFKARPLLALICMGLSYGLMGWYCSAFSGIFHVWAWPLAMAFTFSIIWGWPLILRLVLLTPRILVLSLGLSLTLTIAVSFLDLFILLIMLFASTIFSKLELQTAGVSRILTLVIISVVAGAMIGGGWSLGHHLYLPA